MWRCPSDIGLRVGVAHLALIWYILLSIRWESLVFSIDRFMRALRNFLASGLKCFSIIRALDDLRARLFSSLVLRCRVHYLFFWKCIMELDMTVKSVDHSSLCFLSHSLTVCPVIGGCTWILYHGSRWRFQELVSIASDERVGMGSPITSISLPRSTVSNAFNISSVTKIVLSLGLLWFTLLCIWWWTRCSVVTGLIWLVACGLDEVNIKCFQQLSDWRKHSLDLTRF